MREYIEEDMCIDCGILPYHITDSLNVFLTMSKKDKDTMIETAYSKILNLTWHNNSINYRKVYDNIINI
jgi:hypothetical protein